MFIDPTWIAFISAGAALIASVSGPFVTMRVGQRQFKASVLSVNRQTNLPGPTAFVADAGLFKTKRGSKAFSRYVALDSEAKRNEFKRSGFARLCQIRRVLIVHKYFHFHAAYLSEGF